MAVTRTTQESLELRTSIEDRERVIDQLSTAFAEGRLDHDEYDRRLNLVEKTRTYRELHAVTVGLPIDARDLPHPPRRGPGATTLVVIATVVAVVVAFLAGMAVRFGPMAPEDGTSTSRASTATEPRSNTPSPSAAPAADSASDAEGSDQVTTVPATGQNDAGENNAAGDGASVDAVTRSGEGVTLISVPWQDGVMPMIEFDVEQPAYEVFSLADEDGNPFFVYHDSAATGGTLQGSTVMYSADVSASDQLRMKVDTPGSWTVTIRDVAEAPELGTSGEGAGYHVGWYDGPEGILSVTASDGLFSVWVDDMPTLSGIGPERDEAVIDSGRRLVRIESDSDWEYRVA